MLKLTDPLQGPRCIPLLAWASPTHSPPTDSLHSHVESSFPYQADTALPHTLLPATRQREQGSGSSCSLFHFAKPCHRHRLTPRTRWRQPREQGIHLSVGRWQELPLDVRHGYVHGSVQLLFPRVSVPPSRPLKQGKYLQLGKSKQTAFS